MKHALSRLTAFSPRTAAGARPVLHAGEPGCPGGRVGHLVQHREARRRGPGTRQDRGPGLRYGGPGVADRPVRLGDELDVTPILGTMQVGYLAYKRIQ